jgi:hypothetical protein
LAAGQHGAPPLKQWEPQAIRSGSEIPRGIPSYFFFIIGPDEGTTFDLDQKTSLFGSFSIAQRGDRDFWPDQRGYERFVL